MHCHSLLTSEILVRAGGGHFEHVIYYTFDDVCLSFLWLLNDLLKCTCKYRIDGSICHLKFSMLMVTHIIGEVGTFCIVLLVFIPVLSYQFSLKSVYI